MAYDRALIDWVAEALAPVGTITHRPMMGGAVLSCGGRAFAIVIGDGLWFKADRVSDDAWDAAGCERFTYARANGTATMNYRRAPDDVHDDPEAMRQWALVAMEAAARAPSRTRRRKG